MSESSWNEREEREEARRRAKYLGYVPTLLALLGRSCPA